MEKRDSKIKISRRSFIKSAIATGVLLSFNPMKILAQNLQRTNIWVFVGADKVKLMKKCLEIIKANGGFGAGAKKLALKINAGWNRTPEQGANTHPILIDEFLKGCKKAGIHEVVLPEHSCDSAKATFAKSGIYEVAKKNNAKMIDLSSDKSSFVKVNLDKAVTLKQAEFSKYFLESDVVVNMPVAKHHSCSGLTIAMKNWMGAVKDRGYWHKNNLHQCIADMSTFIKPQWTIIDATRTMMDNGPQGPARVLKTPNMIILSKDQVAADAYTAKTLFPELEASAKYIDLAGKLQAGTIDINKMNVTKFEVS